MPKNAIVKNLDTRHEESAELMPFVEICRDCREGQSAIHKAGAKYLPKLSGQTDEEYNAYKQRATFFNAFSRTVDAFQGMLLRVPPQSDVESPLLDDVTGQGVSLYEFATQAAEEFLVTKFGGILVEHTPQGEDIRTAAQAAAANSRPYLAFFKAEAILNWKYGMVNNRKQLVQVIVEEDEYIQITEFEQEERDIYRVLDLDAEGNYRQRKFIQSDKNKEEFIQISDDIYPLMDGAKLREIPFELFGDCSLPPLMDLAYLNISHYQSTADLENGCHFTALPTPIVTGFSDEKETFVIGSTVAWVFSNPDAKAFYLEFNGDGLGTIEKRIDAKEKQMAVLGARMLSDVAVAETATGANLRSSGEFGILAQIGNALGKVLTRSCSTMLMWSGGQPCTIKINSDFIPAKMSPQELQALVQSWQAGAISSQVLFDNLKQGEIIAQGEDFETEAARIASQGIAPPAV